MKTNLFALIILFWVNSSALFGQKILINMDLKQTDHLKAYGVAYWILEQGVNVEWLLNYRGGSFMTDNYPEIMQVLRMRGVSFEEVSAAKVTQIYAEIEAANMDVVLLEKAPKIVVYTPPNKQVWDDAVTMALNYAEVPYEKVWDEEVLRGDLENYDWLHLHHEDFTGQYGKFYASYSNAAWYKEQVAMNEAMAAKLGFAKVTLLKLAVAEKIKSFAQAGGFVFAMCSATDSFDIALAAEGVDIAAAIYDGDPAQNNATASLDYRKALAFENFRLVENPLIYEYSDIDVPSTHNPRPRDPRSDFFDLFVFSAKYDPVPTMLTQNHVSVIKGFMGQTTAFKKDLIKRSVTIMAEKNGSDEVKYIHGNIGKGTFTFYAGHDPEDYQHLVNDPPTQLALHKNSPGYRLILNNILFPAAKKKKRKT
ncbi:MAG: asparagine synthetase B [Deferribacteres bacterium]|nr:asparagine synthetase B [candidate division KSB1 bacterium]MCB9502928.1 asparagine synthetase B [Deferribacteres bacterium]